MLPQGFGGAKVGYSKVAAGDATVITHILPKGSDGKSTLRHPCRTALYNVAFLPRAAIPTPSRQGPPAGRKWTPRAQIQGTYSVFITYKMARKRKMAEKMASPRGVEPLFSP